MKTRDPHRCRDRTEQASTSAPSSLSSPLTPRLTIPVQEGLWRQRVRSFRSRRFGGRGGSGGCREDARSGLQAQVPCPESPHLPSGAFHHVDTEKSLACCRNSERRHVRPRKFLPPCPGPPFTPPWSRLGPHRLHHWHRLAVALAFLKMGGFGNTFAHFCQNRLREILPQM